MLKGLCTIPTSLTLNTRVGDRKDQIRMTSTITVGSSLVEKDQLQTYMAGENLTCDCGGLYEAPYGGVVSSGEAIPMKGDAETAAIDNLIGVIPRVLTRHFPSSMRGCHPTYSYPLRKNPPEACECSKFLGLTSP